MGLTEVVKGRDFGSQKRQTHFLLHPNPTTVNKNIFSTIKRVSTIKELEFLNFEEKNVKKLKNVDDDYELNENFVKLKIIEFYNALLILLAISSGLMVHSIKFDDIKYKNIFTYKLIFLVGAETGLIVGRGLVLAQLLFQSIPRQVRKELNRSRNQCRQWLYSYFLRVCRVSCRLVWHSGLRAIHIGQRAFGWGECETAGQD